MHNDSGYPDSYNGTALDELRAYLAGLVDVIAEHPNPSLVRDEAQWRLEEIVTELAVPQPSAPRVKSRWMRLAPLLGDLRPDIPVPALSDLLNRAL